MCDWWTRENAGFSWPGGRTRDPHGVSSGKPDAVCLGAGNASVGEDGGVDIYQHGMDFFIR